MKEKKDQTKNDKIEIWKMNKITDFSVNSGLVKWILNKVN